MIHHNWLHTDSKKQIKCIHTKAAKYIVENVLTKDQVYDVKNETEEFYFIIDNTGKVGGFYKDYFEEL